MAYEWGRVSLPYRGFFLLNGQEFLNSSRPVLHLTGGTPTDDTPTECGCANVTVGYDDTWPEFTALSDEGLYPPFFPGDDAYPGIGFLATAPWYTPGNPASSEFVGFWVMDVQGLDSIQSTREVAELLGPGGFSGPRHDATRPVMFDILIIACTNAGQRFGMNWLSCQLRSAERSGATLEFFDAHPGGSAVDPYSLRRTAHRVVLTEVLKTTALFGLSGGQPNRQAASVRAEFTLTALDPYLYGPETVIPVVWDSVELETVEWVHEPDCEGPTDCAPVVLYNPNCLPTIVDLSPAPVPVCGGCLPICGIEVRVFEVPLTSTVCGDMVVSYRVRNTSDVPVTVNFYWRPCGLPDVCYRFGDLQIASLPAGATVVADSVSGRPYALQDGERIRTVGIVTTPTGAPWVPLIVEDTVMCWELVAETSEDAGFVVDLVVQERNS